jgi:hypothetical protein
VWVVGDDATTDHAVGVGMLRHGPCGVVTTADTGLMMVRRRAGLVSIRVYVCREKGGAINAHFPPEVLTTLGHALRRPVGRIHWAGTETAPRRFGFIEGAIRSGERAAEEVSGSG